MAGTVQRELLWERGADGVAWLTLNRPEAGNALSPTLREDLIRRMDDASRDPLTRVVVLAAAGVRHFCTGADLGASVPGPPTCRPGCPNVPRARSPGRSPTAPSG